MRLLASLVIGLLATTAAHAQQVGIFQSYIVTAQNGSFGASTSYGTTGNTQFGSASNGSSTALGTSEGTAVNLGTYNIYFNTLTLNGQVLTFKNGGGDVTAAFLNYRIYPTGAPTGSFQQIGLGFSNDRPFFDIGGVGYTGTANGDQLWANNPSPLNLLTASGFSGIGSQQYTLEVFFSANTNQGTIFNNRGGGNFFATFTVVPEPSTYAAGALLVGLVGWQIRRRKTATATA
ncbi:MAG: hypothetical protein JSR82_12730 [Verrucomicrobia bacterium]|nr:hypothetical protein [Verrucomicrobiota bacterium]